MPNPTTNTGEVNIAVLAGTMEQFKEYAQYRKDGETFIRIDRPEKLYGRDFARVDIIGTFWERRDAGKLYEEVERKFPHLID